MADIREPEVEKVKAPGEEPLCRVGIVLESDDKIMMEASLPPGGYSLTDGKRETSLTSGSAIPLSFKTVDGGVAAFGEEGEVLMKSDDYIAVQEADLQKPVSPGKGMLLKKVVAGRGFHWQKEVDLIFPRRLEFFNRNGKLVVVNVVPMEAYLSCVVTSEMSKECPPEFIKAQAIIKRSAARANSEKGNLDKKLADAVIQASDEVISGKFADQFVLDYLQAGAGTSQNMNVNEVLANRANEIMGGQKGKYDHVHPNDHVNMGQSTNDTIHTAIHIAAVVETHARLLPAVDRLHKALLEKEKEFDGIVKCGRTHLQDAVPIRLGQEFSAFADMLRLAKERIDHALNAVTALPIGGSAVGTGLNTPPGYRALMAEYISESTGHKFRIADNMFEAMSALDAVVEYSGALRVLATGLKKIADDIRLLGSGPLTGIMELKLPAVQPGSSIMPGKVNTVMAEMLNMVCSQAMGCDACIVHAAQGSQLQLNVMMPVVGYNIILMIHSLAGGMDSFTERCIKGLQADEEICRGYAEKSTALATALNPLVGYNKAAELAYRAYKEKRPVRELAKEEKVADDGTLDEALDTYRMTVNPDDRK